SSVDVCFSLRGHPGDSHQLDLQFSPFISDCSGHSIQTCRSLRWTNLSRVISNATGRFLLRWRVEGVGDFDDIHEAIRVARKPRKKQSLATRWRTGNDLLRVHGEEDEAEGSSGASGLSRR